MNTTTRALCVLALGAASACSSSSPPSSSSTGPGSSGGSYVEGSDDGGPSGASSGGSANSEGGAGASSGGGSQGGASSGGSGTQGASGGSSSGATLVAPAPDAGPRAAHVDNPYAGASFYVNPAWAANVTMTASQTSDATTAAALRTISGYPTAVWMDAIARIDPTDGSMSLAQHLDAALSEQKGSMPVTITLVVYDLPGRDCAALASNGELPATSAGLDSYEHQYIDPLVAVVAQEKYAEMRIVTVIEPDSLPNLVTNTSIAACNTAAPFYEQGVEYALDKLHAYSNVYTYLDSGHSGWLGWTSNSGPAAQEFAKVAQATAASFESVDGFITDTANYTPIVEPYMTATQQVGGQPVDSATFYQYNPEIDETNFAAVMYAALTADGFPDTIGMLIDTSRDGWGGSARPAAASTSTDVNTFVNASRIDRRGHRGLWCNVSGAGLGEPPQASPAGHPASHLDAYVWVKPPGESDGTSAATTNSQGKMSDPMCDPTYTTSYGVLTGALPNSPLAGQWFAAQVVQLVQNANPTVP
jgi:cellulose 1,4-beta-cellobiosidase